MNLSLLFKLLIVLCSLSGHALCKECTNTPTELSSHTFRYELLTSNNKTWQDEVFSYYHLAHTDDAAWAHLFPRKMLKEEDKHSWTMMYRQMKDSGGVKGAVNQLKEVSLHDVRLDANSMHGQAQQTNFEYLMWLDVDRLVWSFRKTAGLDTPGQPYGGWEAPTIELRGHFVGHYLSATAQMWASTHNDTLKKKMTDVVSALSACQEKIGSGYLSAFPSDLFDRLEARTPVWAPYYTIHKIMAGLLDQYMFAGNDQALKMVKWMADYFNMRVQNVISKFTLTRHWQTLNDETGGMNDVLYKLYTITGDQKHLTLAHLFDKPCFLGLLAVKSDDLANFHTNTHIPVVVGAQMRYEITGDPLYKDISTFFMDIVNSSHSYATGGTSINEFWSDPKRLADTLQVENEESCTTYNMLKVSRHLFRWTKEVVYADYYERALTNGVLSIQRGRDPGVMIYMLPLGRGVSKSKSKNGWGKRNDTFWCCYGTGIESFSKLGDSIYFDEEGIVPSLYIIQYISSSLNWRSRNISLNQEVGQVTSFDPHLRVTFKFASNEQATSGGEAALNFRIPLWTTSDGTKASLNGQNLPLVNPGNFLSVNRSWTPGDNITFDLPITLRTEAIKDERPEYASLLAILYGPYLLAGLSEGDWDIAAKPAAPFPDWITPVPGDYNSYLVSLSQESSQSEYALTASNASLNMAPFPQPGTNEALASTFRLILDEPKQGNYSGPHDAVGKSVMLEPFNSPGTVITQFGQDKGLRLSPASPAAKFRMSPGLDRKNTSISLESEEKKGCYVYNADTSIVLRCQGGSADEGFKKGSSFTMKEGISEYHPISFVATGVHKKFLLVPLLSLRDENYTVYFNFGA